MDIPFKVDLAYEESFANYLFGQGRRICKYCGKVLEAEEICDCPQSHGKATGR